MKITTLHNLDIGEATDIIKKIQNGEKLPAIHCVDMGEYIKAIEGTHRLLAYKIADVEPNIIMVDYEENKDTPINDIIKDTDGDNDFSKDDTLGEILESYETVGEDLEF